MCGIAGIFKQDNSIEFNTLQTMTNAIAHRGPDGEGHWISNDKNVGFGHRRLSIIDLTQDGKQPMHYAEGRYSITFNGEIYNYIEIKETLIQKGYQFHSKSDTEVLLALFHEKKEKCLQDLDGMFAFVIWDAKERKLFCARDRFGEKPFYYHYKKGKEFVFASEMKAIFASGIPKNSNWDMVGNFLFSGHYVSNPHQPEHTFFEDIYKLDNAHYLWIDEKLNLSKHKYWDIDYTKQNENITFEQAQTQFKELFYTSLKHRLRSDVAVGSSLSGGLDSSTIVCAIDNLNKSGDIIQKTFSARFEGFAKDEGKFMNYVINKTKVEPHFTFPDEAKMVIDLEKLCYHQEEPFGSASMFAQWEVMKLAKENNVTVLIDGQGADEILAGYHNYYDMFFRELAQKDQNLFQKELSLYQNNINPTYEYTTYDIPLEKKYDLKTSLKRFVKKIYFGNSDYQVNNNSSVFHKDFWNEKLNKNLIEDKEMTKFQHETKSNLSKGLYYNTMKNGLQDLLRYADRNSMAHSREVRLPFLNHHLVEFLFTLPNSFKIADGWTKILLRKSFEDILPTEITWRKDKIGYEPPQKNWLNMPKIKEMIEEGKSILIKEKIINPSLQSNNSEWTFLMLGNFLKK